MYPTDDRLIRVRLLINECRKIRLRLEVSIAKSQALRARSAGLIERAEIIESSHGSQDPGEAPETS